MGGAIIRGVTAENGEQRGLTGSGQPGLHTLLGGTGSQEGAETLRFGGGAGQVSATAKLARAHKDLRLAAVVSGTAPPSRGEGGGYGRVPPTDPIGPILDT